MVLIDLTGKTFNRLKVIERAENIGNHTAWLCECSCEKHKRFIVLGQNLRNKSTQSCGCLQRERAKEAHLRPDSLPLNHKRAYSTWISMKNRCYVPTSKSYKDYGARGISVCDRWLYSFKNFLEDMGDRPEGKEIDRIDVNGNYEPGNCRWVTRSENNSNRRKYKMKKSEVSNE
jgi:hypothetical protein